MKANVTYRLTEGAGGDFKLWMMVEADGVTVVSRHVADVSSVDAEALIRFLHGGGKIDIPQSIKLALDGLAEKRAMEVGL